MTNQAFTNVKACVFDAYGTMFDVHSASARVAGGLDGKAGDVSRLWRQKQLEYTWLRSLMGAYVDFWQITGDGLEVALEAHGLMDDKVHKELMDLYLTLAAYPDVRPTLEILQANGLKTGILSNGSPDMLAAAVASAGLERLLDKVISVDEIGIFKPDPRVYQMVLDQMGVSADEVCFVSTNTWDGNGAAYFGFNVAWMNRFGMARERLPGDFKAIIKGLDELPGVLGL